MDAVTYPDAKVAAFINEKLIPLRISYDKKPLSDDFNIKWTPTLIILDEKGVEHRRTVGFLAPDELIPSSLLGIGKLRLDKNQFEDALSAFEEILGYYPGSSSAPEAVYMRGVCRYKIEKDPKGLKEAYEKLEADFPTSEWTKRAYPYRLL